MAKSKESAGKGKSSKTVVKTKGAVKSSARKSVGKTSAAAPTSAVKSTGANQVLEYKLFVEDSVRNLEDQVNYYIGKGWSPVGGVVVQGQNHYMQTMVRQG